MQAFRFLELLTTDEHRWTQIHNDLIKKIYNNELTDTHNFISVYLCLSVVKNNMSYVLTLVASRSPLTDRHLKTAGKIAFFYNLEPPKKPVWLARRKAADLHFTDRPPGPLLVHLREDFSKDGIDVFSTPSEGRRKKLLLADMDATIVTTETLDELAAHVGIKDQIAAITQKAMDGTIDFKTALRERVALLKGLSADKLQETLDETLLSPGADILIKTMKKHGADCVLVSGGFTFFTSAIASRTGFDHHHGNTLDIADNMLNGRALEPILDKESKLDFLKTYTTSFKLNPSETMAIGDGANDLPMLKAAGLGIGYKPKLSVARDIENLIIHGDLTAALYAQGYSDSDFQ